MTVRQRIDQLASEPPVGDLGYAADQRLVASLTLGLQLLADEIDEMRRLPQAVPSLSVRSNPTASDEVQSRAGSDSGDKAKGVGDVATQLVELTDQLKKLTKAVKKVSKRG